MLPSVLHLTLQRWVLAGCRRGEADPTLTAPTFQITAQELSDNRVITLSLAGRKLDKKVSQAGRPSSNSKFSTVGQRTAVGKEANCDWTPSRCVPLFTLPDSTVALQGPDSCPSPSSP